MILILHDFRFLEAGGHHQFARYLFCSLSKTHLSRLAFEKLRQFNSHSSLPTALVKLAAVAIESTNILCNRYTTIVINGVWSPEVAFLASLSILLRRSTLLIPHGMSATPYTSDSFKSSIKSFLRFHYCGWLLSSASYVFATSELEMARLNAIQPHPQKTRLLRPSAIYFPPDHIGNVISSSSLNLSQVNFTGRFNILCAGRHVQAKGSYTLLEVWTEYISLSLKPSNLILMGPIGECSLHLRSLPMNRYHSVTMLDNSYTLDDFELMAGFSDLSISFSPSESFGMVIYESLAFGLPVLCSTGTPWQSLNRFNSGACVPHSTSSYLEALMNFSSMTDLDLFRFKANSRKLAARINHDSKSDLEFLSLIP